MSLKPVIGALVLASLAILPSVLSGQTPKRRGNKSEIAAAGLAFMEGVGGVSRNMSAFTQDVLTNGCEVRVTSRRVERADSLVETHLFDAGMLTSQSTMRIDGTTGAILFNFATASDATVVMRNQHRVAGGASGDGSVTDTPPTKVNLLTLLVANTTQQTFVVAFLESWRAFVSVCGGDISVG